MKNKFWFYQFGVVLMLLVSCVSPKKILYFQGDQEIAQSDTTTPPIVFAPNDIVYIMIYSLDADAVKPFVKTNSGSEEISFGEGYLIDSQGMIYFPVLGSLKIGGLTRIEAVNLIQSKLKEYIKDPVVDVRLKNFQITILGEVNSPGTYPIMGEKITLVEAIGMAGDLRLSGIRKDIKIIRDINGKKVEINTSINTKEIFNSPAYYLRQNDIIYVKPDRRTINSQAINTQNVTFAFSIISMTITLLTFIGLRK